MKPKRNREFVVDILQCHNNNNSNNNKHNDNSDVKN